MLGVGMKVGCCQLWHFDCVKREQVPSTYTGGWGEQHVGLAVTGAVFNLAMSTVAAYVSCACLLQTPTTLHSLLSSRLRGSSHAGHGRRMCRCVCTVCWLWDAIKGAPFVGAKAKWGACLFGGHAHSMCFQGGKGQSVHLPHCTAVLSCSLPRTHTLTLTHSLAGDE